MRDEAGVTLIEMLVVLAVVGVMAGVAVLGLGAAGRRTALESEAQRLAEQVRLAQDEALITGRPGALSWDSEGYGFLAWDDAKARWRVADRPALGRRHELPAGVRLSGPTPSPAILRTAALDFALAGGRERWRVTSDGLNVVAAPAS